ncbi:MAG: acyltransferase [Motiliproteus sp.]|nr:acyltransferase [Motiliproteus sp.]MCW9053548.1 acyltransferase [Motiliproteus sp.]
MENRAEVLSLTGLRFIAAFYVFLFHIHIRYPLSDNFFVKNILDQGAVGMSLFFILSGFILSYRYSNEGIDTRKYLLNRFARIYPIYVFAAIVTLPWIGVSISAENIVEQISRIVLLVFSNVFLIQAWFPQFFNYWNDGASWSISVEAFFYILFPLMMPVLKCFSNRSLILMLAFLLLFSSLPGFVAELYSDSVSRIYYSLPIYRLSEFVIGICIFFASKNIRFTGSAFLSIQFVILIVFFSYLGFFGATLPLYIGHNWIVVPVISLLIVSLYKNKGGDGFLSGRTMVWLGKISYCFYSLQALVILLLIDKRDQLISVIPALNNSFLLFSFLLLLLIFLSALAYYFVEEPCRKWIKYRYSRF